MNRRAAGFMKAAGRLLSLWSAWAGPAPAQEVVTAFVDVTVVPMDHERVLERQTVVVRGGRIAALGPADRVRVPGGARVIDGAGRFLLPGLADMHVHLGGLGSGTDAALAERQLVLCVANGVTTVRNMYSEAVHLRLRARAARGELLSPHIYTAASASLVDDGDSTALATAAARVIDSLRAAGYDFVKIPAEAASLAFDALIRAARQAEVPVVGHGEGALEAAFAARFASIEHIRAYRLSDLLWPIDSAVRADPAFRVDVWRYLDTTKIAGAAAVTRLSGAWLVPTMVMYDDPANPDMTPRTLAILRRLLKGVHDGGVRFLLGTDAPVFGGQPGFAVHRELQAYVAAGLTPYQALVTATRHPAEFLGTLDSAGTVAVGKRADLVLLGDNPLIDIRHTARIEGVMLGGRWLERRELDTHLAGAADEP